MSEVDTGLPPIFDTLLAGATDEPLAPHEIEALDDSDDDAPSRTRKPRSDKGKPRGPRGGSPTPRSRSTSDKKLADDLLNPWAKIIKGVAFAAPTMAAVMTQQGEQTMNALVAVASPKMKAALSSVARIGPGADLIEAIAMMLVAGGLDFGMVKPGSVIAEATGVQPLYDLVHPPKDQDQHFSRPEVDHDPAADNVHPFPSSMPDYPAAGGSMFMSYPGAPAS
jgi:hypothetical protein